ncbi:MAG: hypothetical protein M5U26_11465 [Planctomycetota bacterium]|nr:hypothetical protein [Planctomycetota bacterium]
MGNSRSINFRVVQKAGGHYKSFQREVIGSIGRWKFPPLARQRLYVNPVDGSLLLGEGDIGYAKAFTRLLHINPETGKGNEVESPMSTEDLGHRQEWPLLFPYDAAHRPF